MGAVPIENSVKSFCFGLDIKRPSWLIVIALDVLEKHVRGSVSCTT